MTRDFLKKQFPDITEEQINAILNENGRDLEALRSTVAQRDQTIQTLTTERDGYKSQVTERDNDINALREQVKGNEQLTSQLNTLQTKYDNDTKALQNKLDEERGDRATESAFKDVKFSSNAARSAAISAFKAKGYKLGEDGKYAEAAGFIEQLKKDDPGAFVVEDNQPPANDGAQNPPPQFTHQMTNNQNGGSNAPLQGLFFQPVRNTKKNE